MDDLWLAVHLVDGGGLVEDDGVHGSADGDVCLHGVPWCKLYLHHDSASSAQSGAVCRSLFLDSMNCFHLQQNKTISNLHSL